MAHDEVLSGDMSFEGVFKVVKQILVNVPGIDENSVTYDADIFKDLGVDSTDYNGVLCEIENIYEITLVADHNVSTVRTLIVWIFDELRQRGVVV